MWCLPRSCRGYSRSARAKATDEMAVLSSGELVDDGSEHEAGAANGGARQAAEGARNRRLDGALAAADQRARCRSGAEARTAAVRRVSIAREQLLVDEPLENAGH